MTDIRIRQMREVLDEDRNANKQSFQRSVKVQQMTPQTTDTRVPIEGRVRYNINGLFNKFRLQLEDTIDDYNDGVRLTGVQEIISSYNNIINYISAYTKTYNMTTQDKSYIEQKFNELLEYVNTVGQIARTDRPVDLNDMEELVNMYPTRQPVGVSSRVVSARTGLVPVVADQDAVYAEAKDEFNNIFLEIENDVNLNQQEKDNLSVELSDIYDRYREQIGVLFENARNQNTAPYRSAEAKLRNIIRELQPFFEMYPNIDFMRI